MIAGQFVGMPVLDAKPKCKEAMVGAGTAFIYLEPENMVTPRSTPDVECVVALVDQWYLKYAVVPLPPTYCASMRPNWRPNFQVRCVEPRVAGGGA